MLQAQYPRCKCVCALHSRVCGGEVCEGRLAAAQDANLRLEVVVLRGEALRVEQGRQLEVLRVRDPAQPVICREIGCRVWVWSVL